MIPVSGRAEGSSVVLTGVGLTALGWERARWWHRDLVLACAWTQLWCGLYHSAAPLPGVRVQEDNHGALLWVRPTPAIRAAPFLLGGHASIHCKEISSGKCSAWRSTKTNTDGMLSVIYIRKTPGQSPGKAVRYEGGGQWRGLSSRHEGSKTKAGWGVWRGICSPAGRGQGWLRGPLLQTVPGTWGGRAQRASVTVTMLAATSGLLIQGCGPPRAAGLPWNHGKWWKLCSEWSSSLGRKVGARGAQTATLVAVEYMGKIQGCV